MEASFTPPTGHPTDYFVPNLGEDSDISVAKKNIAMAEKKLDHVIDTSPAPPAQPRDYFVPHFGED